MEWVNRHYLDHNWADVNYYENVSHSSCLVLAKFSMVSLLLSYGLKLLRRHRLEGISRKD